MSAAPLPLDREAPAAGALVEVAPGVRRLVAPNPGPFTFTGTCTYVLGAGAVTVVDPGPALPAHIDRLLDALGEERVEAILVTHTHRDHSPGAAGLKARTGAPVLGCGPHRAARPSLPGEGARLDAAADGDFRPDRELADGERVVLAGVAVEVVATPGHTMNHLAYALPGGVTLSGDHVMAWSTTVVAPPDGAMGPYMASLERLRARGDGLLLPGHGGPVRDPGRFLRALLGHRRAREAAVLARLRAGDRRVGEVVARLYEGLAPALVPAAALSVLAHLEDLAARGLVAVEAPGLSGAFRAA